MVMNVSTCPHKVADSSGIMEHNSGSTRGAAGVEGSDPALRAEVGQRQRGTKGWAG